MYCALFFSIKFNFISIYLENVSLWQWFKQKAAAFKRVTVHLSRLIVCTIHRERAQVSNRETETVSNINVVNWNKWTLKTSFYTWNFVNKSSSSCFCPSRLKWVETEIRQFFVSLFWNLIALTYDHVISRSRKYSLDKNRKKRDKMFHK